MERFGAQAFGAPLGPGGIAGSAFDPEGLDEGLLGDFDPTYGLHALLALPLLVEKLSLAGDVTAVALGDDVLAPSLHRLPRDDLAANSRLDRDIEQLARYELAQLLGHPPAVRHHVAFVHDGAERVDRDAV